MFIFVTDATNNDQTSPTNGTWYNVGSFSISIPVGAWDVRYMANGYYNAASGTDAEVRVTLSTANNSESDATLSGRGFYRGSSEAHVFYAQTSASKRITLTTKDTYYLNCMTNESAGTIGIRGASANPTTVICADCAYL